MKVSESSKIDWRTVILKIQERHNWPLKTIVAKVKTTYDTMKEWRTGTSEPKHSQGVELLRLAGME